MSTRLFTTRRSKRGPLNQLTALVALMLATLMCTSSASSATSAADFKPANFRVIVHPNNPLTSASRDFIAQAFFKRTTRWGGGESIHPVDLRPDASVRREFSDGVLNRSVAAVRSYWQQRIFSGRDLPPPELDSDEAVIKYVASSPGAIGYVSGAAHLGHTKELQLH